MNNERYSVGSDDGVSVYFKKEEDAFSGKHVTLRFEYIILLVFMLFSGKLYITVGTDGASENSQVVQSEEVKNDDIQNDTVQKAVSTSIDQDGFVFPDSSDELLTKEMVLGLVDDESVGFQRLLRLAINEIYARHGHDFVAGGENAIFYQQYEWYNEKQKHHVEWSEFNKIEKANLRLLISVEEEYGFR